MVEHHFFIEFKKRLSERNQKFYISRTSALIENEPKFVCYGYDGSTFSLKIEAPSGDWVEVI